MREEGIRKKRQIRKDSPLTSQNQQQQQQQQRQQQKQQQQQPLNTRASQNGKIDGVTFIEKNSLKSVKHIFLNYKR